MNTIKQISTIGILVIIAFSCNGDKSKAPIRKTQIEIEDSSGLDPSISEHKKVDTSDSTEDLLVNVVEKTMAVEDVPKNKIRTPVVKSPKKETARKPKPTIKAKTVAKKTAEIEFEKTVYDFGEILEGDIIKFDLNFINTGTGPLQILEVDVSCGCTTPTVPFLDIEPGQSNKIEITYNSVNKSGSQNTMITIKTNTKPAYTDINLKGYVKENPNKKKIIIPGDVEIPEEVESPENVEIPAKVELPTKANVSQGTEDPIKIDVKDPSEEGSIKDKPKNSKNQLKDN